MELAGQMTITLLTGRGEFSDPWHDFVGIGAALAPGLALRGTVEASEQVDATLEALPTVRPELLVLCVGDDGSGGETPSAAARDGLSRYLLEGGRMLALHATATAFPRWPRWQQLLGGRWLPDESFHPPYGPATVHLTFGGTLAVDDERYTALHVDPGVTVLAWHEWEGQRHPLSWLHRVGDGLVVFDALGHDAASYHQPERLRLLDSELDLLLGR